MRRVILNRRDFIELSESVLNQYGCLRFEAHGSSMYPFIRSGDVLTVRPAEPAALNVGDVALYRAAQDRLVAHRVVGKYVQDDDVDTRHVVSLRMRGDAASGTGEQVRARQILGQVVSVQRGSKISPMHRGYRRLLANEQASRYASSLICGFGHLKRIASRLLCWLQRLRLYRSLARRLIGNQVRYRVAGAEDAYDCFRLYGYNRFPELENPVEAFADQLGSLEGYGCILIADVEGRIAGAVVIRKFPQSGCRILDAGYSMNLESRTTRDPESQNFGKSGFPALRPSGMWLFGLLVHTRYRGAGIGEGLVQMALQKAVSEGATRINLMVSSQNRAALNLYRKVGFRRTSMSKLDGQMDQQVREGEQQRIIMSLDLSMKNNGDL